MYNMHIDKLNLALDAYTVTDTGYSILCDKRDVAILCS